jgi:hypothetical protein
LQLKSTHNTQHTHPTTGSAHARELQQVRYVPGGCQNLGFTTTASVANGIISGTVVVTNPQQYDVPIQGELSSVCV